ncbi:uncharacterized mitochondrial protein-like protein [Tanacetum coccineum]
MSIDDLYNNFKIVKQSVKKSVSASSSAQNLAFMTALSTSSTNDVNTAKPAYEVSTVSPNVNTASPQITEKSKKGLGYNVVPPPHPLIYNRPKKLDLSYSGLDEFKEPEFKSYGSEDSKKESNNVCDKKSDASKENSDDSLVKGQVSEDTSSFVKSSPNVDKETVFLDKKIEFFKHKNHEKPVKKSIRCDNGTEFKNKFIDDFCREKGIRREYSVARTPQQNGVAERRNRTLIEAARAITKLGKFDGKSDERFFVGYSLSIAAGTITNESAGTQGELNACTSTQKEEISQDCIVMPIWKDDSYFDSPSKDVSNSEPKSVANDQKQVEDGPDNENDEKDKSEDEKQSLKKLMLSGREVCGVGRDLDENKITYVDDIIFGSTNKELCTAFEKLMKDKFQMSSMGELTFFLGLQVTQKEDGIFISQDKYVAEILKKFNYTDVKSASTPVDLEKPLVKDGDADDVDVHLYRSMIGSLMYLTTSRPDIMFAVCACARFQVTPKTSHLLAIKRIFRYLKGKPTLGLWYSRDSPFELVAYTDSDYAGATQDRKSTTGGYLLTKGFDAGRHVKRGQDTKIPQSSGPPIKVGDEVVHKELGDRMERAATTASSLEAEQDSGNIK